MPETAVKTVDRIAALLRVLAGQGAGGLSLTDIAKATGFGPATTHRLLAALTDVGFACQDLPTKHYRLGAVVATLGRAALQQDVAQLADGALARLAAATGDTSFASVREGLAAICIGRAVGAFPIRTLTLDVGDRRPLGVGAGSLALLAALPDAEIRLILVRNADWLKDFSGFTADAILRLVERTRADGHAFNDGLIVPAMNAVAVAVHDADGRPLFALSLAAIRDRMTPDRRAELVALLHAEAEELERRLPPLALDATSGSLVHSPSMGDQLR
ncbi:IclR family transcriptional regulator [Aliidongia dinghuensis]|uniref:IclR family transcriptional regulator n=1 Tax=Aliidongia dinghuensis TaxID=1867774 RepID=A0A8J3E592_9PROT|nr:IclR family transcriptional regulator [Aliidongia dinghuensis]GGF33858.1 IclR family transcriptional regulator [Aliidongia dinghuensis]